MIVRISDYCSEKSFVEYEVSGLTPNQMDFLNNVLKEDCEISSNCLKIRMFFKAELYPFQSEDSKIRLEDFISREEIEMNLFLSSILEDM